MRDAPLVQQAREQLRLGHRGGADEHGLAERVALDDVVDDRVELGLLGLEDQVRLVGAHHVPVGRDGHHGQPVGGGELAGLRLGRPGHAGELLVHAEVVLQGHRGPGVVLLLDGHALLRLDRLVQPVGPAAALEGAPGELVDDLHLAAGDEIVLVPLVEVLRRQGLGQLVDVVDRDGVVDVVDPDRLLHLLDARLQRDHRLLLLVDLVVDVAGQGAGDGGELVVQLGRLVGRARDDQRRAGLVDEDGVDLVDDGEHVLALGHLLAGAGHVVAQVVEAELVVGAVGDVRAVGGPLEHGVLDRGRDQADGQPEPAVDPAHPLGVARGQVLVHRDHVHAPAVEPVEVGGQRGDEGLALAGLHLGDPAEVQRHPAHELHVEVALPEDPPARLADDGVGLDEEVVQRLPLVQALAELDRLVGERLVAQRLHVRLEGADERHELGQPPDLLALTGFEDLREHAHGAPILPAPGTAEPYGLRAADLVFDPTLACREGDAPVPAARRRHRTQRHHADACRLVSARPRQPGTRRAGLTSKPHHAQRPQVALRGSFRLRLASTCNHRPARSPPPCYVVPAPTPRRTLPGGRTRLAQRPPCLRLPIGVGGKNTFLGKFLVADLPNRRHAAVP